MYDFSPSWARWDLLSLVSGVALVQVEPGDRCAPLEYVPFAHSAALLATCVLCWRVGFCVHRVLHGILGKIEVSS